MLRKLVLLFSLLLPVLTPAFGEDSGPWQFVFMTDIHIQPEARAVEGFQQALRSAEAHHPDFIVTGGDLIMDALRASHGRADSLYRLYIETVKDVHVPVYNTPGNHETYGWSKKSHADPNDPDYGKGMWARFLGKRYYSFDHKGWHFIILDSIIKPDSGSYAGGVDSTELAWLRADLATVAAATPIIAVTHIPLMSCMIQFQEGATVANGPSEVIQNSKDVLDAFVGHNLRYVLQGHMHFLEDIFVQNKIHFLTGGAVCAKWWKGPNNGLEEGYLALRVAGNDVTWNYIDYGWNAQSDSTK
jgi:3',5'-cyclic-AMP phosphodiesterase